ncbi:type II secretion system protein [bacterium]|nr:type II secretion system protein [bacterium]
MKSNKKAFTLIELLIALSVVGVLAVMSIPSLSADINKKLLTNQIKNTYISIQQLVGDQLTDMSNKTTILSNTDFSSPAALLNDLETVDDCSTVADCWPENSEDKPAYRTLNKLENKVNAPTAATRILKNGVAISYELIDPGITTSKDICYGLFWVDVNAKDKPNIIGRDMFAFYVTKYGKLVDDLQCKTLLNEAKVAAGEDPEEESSDDDEENPATIEEKWEKACKEVTNDAPEKATECITHIQTNGWKMLF